MNYSDVEVIAAQAKIIFQLNNQLSNLKLRLHKIQTELVCIGGPLNDNVLNFSKTQKLVCQRILDEAEYEGDE